MVSTQSGSFRLFRVAGIDVYLHWTWFLAAWYFLAPSGSGGISGISVAAYLTLFAIVLVHEFGHALAARQVGGEAREIILWPLGGIAFAKVPPRPGAEAWTVAAGPLVNVVLFPILAFLAPDSPAEVTSQLQVYFMVIHEINLGLLLFNILPIYPLDGGQLLRALLWYKLGRAESLRIATIIGFVAIPLALAWRFHERGVSLFTLLIAGFVAMECFRGYKQSQLLRQVARLPRHTGYACPTCQERPPGGPFWNCPSCQNRFDPFSTRARCPHCSTVMPKVPCALCGSAHAIEQWDRTPPRRPGDPPVIDV